MAGFDQGELLEVAREAAHAAATVLLERFGARATGVVAKSGPTDLVSDADFAAEAAIREVLARRRPDEPVLGEEGGEGSEDQASGWASASGSLRWVVDPLDGTINFLFGIPMFAVSVACEDSDGAVAGVVLDPIRDECFEAGRSGPARMNGEVISGSQRSELATALIATGFGYDAAVRARQADVVASLLPQVRDIRRCGSAALDLAWTACGRFDAYYERGVKPWDVAAGSLIAGRAGLEVRELPARGEDPAGLLAAPRELAGRMFALVVG